MESPLMTKAEEILKRTIQRCRELNIIIPTYRQMRDPDEIPAEILAEVKGVGIDEVNPRNLFRITWKNDPREKNGGFGKVNFLELPSEITGVPARIVMLLGRFFPTGAHKVGATFGPLVHRLIQGQFDPTRHKALWPSTGNYCRGGAFNAALLGCPSIAVLPEAMSQERFNWLEKIGAEVFKTPGGESNVKEIYDKTKSLAQEREEVVVLNQFAEMANPLWHYAVTGPAMEEVFQTLEGADLRFSGLFLTQGSGGTLGSGEYLREQFPLIKIATGEALQCPTLLYNGYGSHRIEGIGDKHVPWIMNIKNIDMVIGIDDNLPLRLMRLFNEPTGYRFLEAKGVDPEIVRRLPLLGISGIANLVGAIKMARYYEFNERDTVFTVATDSMEMYQSRLVAAQEKEGTYSSSRAAVDFEAGLQGLTIDYVQELSYYDRKRIHNLKYFTWVEQQGKTVEELDAQWYDETYWSSQYHALEEWDERIREFNQRTGLVKRG
jgi:cysteine synthase